MPTEHWLLLSPQLPTTPSSLRVLVWRRLQHLGALNVQNGLWLLPQTPEHEHFLNTVLTEIEQHEGTALVFRAQLVDVRSQECVLARFQEERQKEYTEFTSRCQEFHHELEQETQARNWTFAELEENEHDLQKLTQWLRQIQRRDFFPNASSQEAVKQLDRCTEHLRAFAQMVYAHQGVISSEEASSVDEEVSSQEVEDGKQDERAGEA